MITAWRICQRHLVATAFEGHGAAAFPGRWNLLGSRVVYTAENRALAAWEILAHSDRGFLTVSSWSTIQVQFDEALVSAPANFPSDWRRIPAPDSTRKFGGDWIRTSSHPVLRVPSAVILGEFNYILNPGHIDFPKILIGVAENFSFDPRTM